MTRSLCVLVLPLSFWPGPIQQPESPPQTFAASVALVSLDVVALDADGGPLEDLRPEDFVVKLDGQQRRVVSARFRRHAGSQAVVTPASDAPFSTNEVLVQERVLTVVVDQDSLGSGSSRVMTTLGNRLLEALGPTDQMALLTLPGPAVRAPHTADRAQLRSAFGSVFGRQRTASARLDVSDAMAFVDKDSVNWEQVSARLCPPSRSPNWEEEVRRCVQELESEARVVAQGFRAEADAMIAALRNLVGALGKFPGTKHLVLVSGGFSDRGGSDLESLADEATAAQVRFHVVLVEDAALDASQRRLSRRQGEERRLRADGPMRLAGLAGAVFHQAVGSGEALYRLANELAGDYALGFEPELGDADGRPHRVVVEVLRRGVTVRSQGSVTLRAPGGKPDEILAAALQSRELRTDLRLKVATYSLQAPEPDRIRLLMSAEIGADAQGATGAAVLYALADATGRVVASGHQPLSSERDASGPAFVSTAVVPPGRYTLKLAALDQKGRVGSVRHPVRAALVDAPGLTAGDLILAAASSDEHAAPRPGVDVEIQGGALAAYLEVYAQDDSRLEGVAVAIEVAEEDEAKALLSVPASQRLVAAGRRAFQGHVDVGALPPGAYQARAIVSVPGGHVRRLQRPFRVAGSTVVDAAQRPLGLEDVAAAFPRFDPASVLRADVIGPALDQLQARSTGAPVALARRQLEAGSIQELTATAEGTREPLAAGFLRGVAAYARGEYPAAAGQLRGALRAAADFLPAAIYLGACYAAQGRDLDAAGAWQTAMMRDGGGPPLRRLVAEALLRGSDAEGALEQLQEARVLWPDDARLRRTEGLALAAQGRRAEALVGLVEYVDGHPEDISVLYLTARLLFDQFVEQAADFKERQRLLRYARAYVEAGGPERPAVGRWIEFIEKH